MKIYHFRILLDSAQDIFRDIQIAENAPFVELHDAIVNAFSFSGLEMASFYMSNEDWDKGEEIALMDVMDVTSDEPPLRTMDKTAINHLLSHKGDKMLYLYDFLRMWIFYVELMAIVDPEEGLVYPQTVLQVGDAPREDSREISGSMPVDFADGAMYGEDEDEYGDEDFDSTDDYEAFR